MSDMPSRSFEDVLVDPAVRSSASRTALPPHLPPMREHFTDSPASFVDRPNDALSQPDRERLAAVYAGDGSQHRQKGWPAGSA
jgi:hypothetical protein